MHRKVRPSAARPGSNWSRMLWTVVSTMIPSSFFTEETTVGNLMEVHLETRAPMTNRPMMAAIWVIFLSCPPPTSVTISVPRS